VNAGQFVSRLTRKSRSNFFYAFLCLPRVQREAIYACYAFCRIVDDAVDLVADRAQQGAELARWREEIARVYEGRPEHPAGQRLQVAVRRFPIPRAALEESLRTARLESGDLSLRNIEYEIALTLDALAQLGELTGDATDEYKDERDAILKRLGVVKIARPPLLL